MFIVSGPLSTLADSWKKPFMITESNRKCFQNFHRFLNVLNLRQHFFPPSMSSISQSIYFPSDRWNPIERGKKRTKKIERNTKAPSSFDALIPFEMCANSTRSLYTCTSDIAYIWNIIHTRVNSIRISSFSLELILVLVDAEIDCTSWNDERWRLFQISLKSMVGEDNRCG